MRFIIREQPYERLLAAGLYIFAADGIPTGTKEEWRLTSLVDGFRTLRIDIDDRQNLGNRSALHHLVLNPSGAPERLKSRIFSSNEEIALDVHLDTDSIAVYVDIGSERKEHELAISDYSVIMLPSTFWLGHSVFRTLGKSNVTIISLSESNLFMPSVGELSAEFIVDNITDVCGYSVENHTYNVSWNGRECRMAIDNHGFAIEQVFRSGLSARETKYIRHLNFKRY